MPTVESTPQARVTRKHPPPGGLACYFSFAMDPAKTPDRNWPADRRARGELLALALTGTLHLLFESFLAQKTLFLVTAGAGWAGYLGLSVARRPGLLRDWGLWPAPLRSFSLPALVFLAGAAALGIAGALLGHRLLLPLHSTELADR
jgi:hypothetical protein